MSDASLWITIFAVACSCAALALVMILKDRLTVLGKTLERDRGRMEAVLEAAVDGVVIIDEHGIVESINSACERIFGYTADEVVGRNVSFLMPEPYRSQHDGYLAAYLATGTPRIIGIGREVEGRRKDGTTFPMNLAVGESRIDGRRLFAGIIRDISEAKETERRLRTGEAKTRAILEAAADGILTIDQGGIVLGLNAAAERIFGYAATEVIGRNVKMLMPEPYRSAHDSYLDRYIRTGERRIIGIGREVEGRRKSGAVFPMDLAVGEAVVGGDRFFTGIVRDATERKRTEEALRQSEERLRMLLDNVRDYAIGWLDLDGRIAGWNPGGERVYGLPAAEAAGEPLKRFHPAEGGAAAAAAALEKVRLEGRFEEEGWRSRADGQRFWAHEVITPLLDDGGRMRGYAWVSRDISDRKRVDEALKAAKEEAERANIAKSRFLAAASHDLRQPVQALVFFTSALAAKVREPGAVRVLGDLEASLDSLNVLLDSLLDVSRLDAGIVTPRATRFSVSALLDRVANDMGPLMVDKELGFRVVGSSAVVRSDPTLLGRILQNFVTNATRYTPSGGRILIGCRRRGRNLRIEVWDTGIGIPPDRLDDIFQEFTQVGNFERDRAQGLGLGLAIVRRLANLLGHPIGVRSQPGRGSVFSVEVPLVGWNRARNVAYLSQPQREEERRGGFVFVIDDEAAVRSSLAMVLENWGYEVLSAASEGEALDVLARHGVPPDVILADYRLQGGSTGADVIRNVRRLFDRAIPGIIITGDTAPERLRDAEASGASLLHKPVRPIDLQSALAHHLGSTA